jgi:hypothetical protein
MIRFGLYKFGIYNKVQLKDLRKLKTALGDYRKISITLYDQIINEPNAEALAECILLEATDDRGAYKRTYEKRFESFDAAILNHINQQIDGKNLVLVHDLAVSDGRTAVDFFEKLSKKFPKISYTASDYSPNVFVIERKLCTVTFSPLGKVLEILFPPFVFKPLKRERYASINYVLSAFLQFFVVPSILKKWKEGQIKAKELLLFAPNVLKLSQKDDRFKLMQHNILTMLPETYDIVRAMNILNTSYFSKNEFKVALKNIYQGLKVGGFFITGSNQDADSLVHGGLYQKTAKGFKKVWQSGDGSIVDELILKAHLF